MMEYLSASQAAEKWNISQRRVQILCSENRIEGAFKVGEVWVIPYDAPKPTDLRKKSNKNEENCK
ncbi:transposase [Clostridium folliculivorans]|uniref:Transposase n=2 Tax=Clostridium folliculivorans TaxID=2886038 RepID=A0A9W5Y0M1_9CLOT|nr:transposase [Clostridium folliculivorans]